MGDVTALGNAGANPASETYAYDPLYRLSAVTDAGGSTLESYTYNPTGDRLSKTSSGLGSGTYSYTTGTHQLASIGTDTRANDPAGNTTGSVIGGETFGFGYNGRNRLALAQRNGDTVGNYSYNAFGQRIGKASTYPGANSERYSYDEAGHLTAEYGDANRDYLWLGDLPIAVIDNTTSGGTTTSTVNYITADQLGTPRAVADSNGTLVWSWAYQGNPFGQQQPTSSTGYVLNLRYPGQYYDAETGTNYNYFRTYEPATGRYLQSDPIGLNGGVSTYAYVAGNPLSDEDPSGLDAVLLINTRTVFVSSGWYGGHAAVAIGDDVNGWHLYSEDGYVNGRQVTQNKKYDTLSQVEASMTDYPDGRGGKMDVRDAYDMQQGEHTAPGQDLLMKTWAEEHLKDKFDGGRNNCGDFALGVLRAGGLKPSGDGLGPTIPRHMSIGPDNDPGRFDPLFVPGATVKDVPYVYPWD